VTQARKEFAAASAAIDPQAGDALKKASAATESLRAAVAARRAELANEVQKRAAAQQTQVISAKENELTDATRNESAARDAFQAKRQELDRIASRERAYMDAKEELDRISRLDEPTKRQEVAKLASDLASAERMAEAAVRPAPPSLASVTHIEDPRGLYAAGSLGALAMLFGLVLVLNGVTRASH